MTDQEINIAIAKACGWHVIALHQGKTLPSNIEAWTNDDKTCRFKDELPDYLHDLNACAEFEKTLSIDQLQTYASHLAMRGNSYFVYDYITVLSSAHQRCEAFLKTVGKWKE